MTPEGLRQPLEPAGELIGAGPVADVQDDVAGQDVAGELHEVAVAGRRPDAELRLNQRFLKEI